VASKSIPARLKAKSDFEFLFKAGRKVYPSSWMVVNVGESKAGIARFGWTLPRYVGTAVIRNKLKRWCREFLRHNPECQNKPLDVNFVFRRKNNEFYARLTHEELDQVLFNFFRKIS
jgi:ribonuclease P protein component